VATLAAQPTWKDLIVALSVTKLSAAMGVRIDYDLRVPMCIEDQQALSQLLDQHQLLLFRDQHLEPSDQVRVVGYIGDVIDTDDVISNVDPDGKKLQEGELVFHQDLAFSEIPLFGISLYGKTVTEGCAPTRYANAQRALSLLPNDLDEELAHMTARHVFGFGTTYTGRNRLADLGDECMTTVHPVLFPNPRTGQPVLYVSEMQTDSIVELEPERSEDLLVRLKAAMYQSTNTYDHAWRRGDLVIWDNIALQHARAHVAADEDERTLTRVTFGDPRCWDYRKTEKYANLTSVIR
jgi:taurine dioxygenase